jgi:hypothetical protein
MDGAILNPEIFTHVRVIIGIIMGLSLSRLPTGVGQIIKHPQEQNIYIIHLGWVLFTFLTVAHFWWLEFYLDQLMQWKFETYLLGISMEGFSGIPVRVVPRRYSHIWGMRHS